MMPPTIQNVNVLSLSGNFYPPRIAPDMAEMAAHAGRVESGL